MHNWDGLTTPALHREKQHTGTVGLVSSFPDYSGKAKVRTASCCSYEIPCVSVVQTQLSKSELADFSHFVVTVYSLVFLTWAPDFASAFKSLLKQASQRKHQNFPRRHRRHVPLGASSLPNLCT